MTDESIELRIENFREKLYSVNQQLRLLAQLTVHERHSPVTIQSETFSVAMSHLAEQVREVIEYAEKLSLEM